MMPLEGYKSLCEERQRIIVSKDEKQNRQHRAKNLAGRRVNHYHIDGDVIRDNSPRCDFLLLNEDSSDAYLIELKGSDIEHALVQLETTAKRLEDHLCHYTVRYRLVHSKARTTALRGTKFKKFQQQHSKPGEFIHKETLLEESI